MYGPNDVSGRIALLHYVRLFVKCHATSTANTLVGGDFNCIDDVIDKDSWSTDKSSIEFSNLKTDSVRLFNCYYFYYYFFST